jgi:hypothetical protein
MANSEEMGSKLEPTRTGLTERLKNRRKGRKSTLHDASMESDDFSSGGISSMEHSLTLDLSESNRTKDEEKTGSHRRRRSGFFHRRKRREAEDDVPGVPDIIHTQDGDQADSKSVSEDEEESLGLARSIDSGNVTEDSEAEGEHE